VKTILWTLVIATAAVAGGALIHAGGARPWTVPDRLTDQQFWKLINDSSEPGGYFRNADITNLTSNEMLYGRILTDLSRRTRPGGVYLGVGPEQNYTYIAALKPRLAVIFDIRRGNLDLQLMYKAIFELSKDRADFVSTLFSKQRVPGLNSSLPAARLFAAFNTSKAVDEASFMKNLAAIEERLTKTHAFALPARDLEGIREIYRTFYQSGFAIRLSPTYDELMAATDEHGVERSYLASEENYAIVRDLETKNLIVPVVGDFAGPKAIRSVAKYLKETGATVAAFYLSNVEQYLDNGKWDTFCRSVGTLPLDNSSTFIRSQSGAGRSFGLGAGGGFVSSISPMANDIQACASR
jgi:hypothetical protein